MLTNPVAAARAVVATGAWVKSKHDMYLIHTWKCGSSSFIFTHPPEDKKKRKKQKEPHVRHGDSMILLPLLVLGG